MTDLPPPMVYRPAVITFLDVLGFRERVGQSQDPTEVQHILRRLRSFAARRDDVAADDDSET